MRLIDADKLKEKAVAEPETGEGVVYVQDIDEAPTIPAIPADLGWWKEYTRSALVNWKDGEPVWADRAVYRCSKCDFGTIIKHNYCPRCGTKNG